MRLPNIANATIDIRKLRDYALNPNHPEGRHKARVFLSALGITASDSEWLASVILRNIAKANAVEAKSSVWGVMYQADLQIRHGHRCAKVRTGWLCRDESATLTTCFVVGECDETT